MPTKLSDRRWPWLYEMDGSLNPTWLMVVAFDLLGLVAAAIALASGLEKAIIAALSYLSLMTVVHLISALPKDKAKILAQSKVIAAGIRGPLRGSAEPNLFTDDERGAQDG